MEAGGQGEAETVEFYCHRDILWFASPFFRSLLEGDWKETNLDSPKTAQDGGNGDDDDDDDNNCFSDVSDEDLEDEEDDRAGQATAVSDEGHANVSPELRSTRRGSVRSSFHTATFSLDDAQHDACRSDTLHRLEGRRSSAKSTGAATTSSSSSRLASMAKLATPPTSRRGSRSSFGGRPVSVRSASSRRQRHRMGTSKKQRSKDKAPAHTPSSPYPTHRLAAVIDLPEDDAETLSAALAHVYPHLSLSITWRNAAALLRFADKYDVYALRRCVIEDFLRTSLAGRPILALRIADEARLRDIYKEASRHVLDHMQQWDPEELAMLSAETLLKLERRRTWFLERLLKLGLTLNPGRDFLCQAHCPHPEACAALLHERWTNALAVATRFGPPTPSVVWRHLRELETGPAGGAASLAASSASSSSGLGGVGSVGGGSSAGVAAYGPKELAACHQAAKAWVQVLFDRMFELSGSLIGRGGGNPRFVTIKLDS